jgi:hypothetical protein
MQLVYHQVHPGNTRRTRAVEPEQAKDGALDGDGRVPADEVQHLCRDAVGQSAAARHPGLIQMEIGHDPAVGEPHGRLICRPRLPRKEIGERSGGLQADLAAFMAAGSRPRSARMGRSGASPEMSPAIASATWRSQATPRHMGSGP